jgi:hypothetical protein
MFGWDIQARANIERARDVRTWLGERGVQPAFQLKNHWCLGYPREEVEALLERELRRVEAPESTRAARSRASRRSRQDYSRCSGAEGALCIPAKQRGLIYG